METERFIEIGETQRWRLDTPIQIYVRDDSPHLAGHSRDISLYGIQIELGIDLALDSIVKLEIYFQRNNVLDFIAQEPLQIKAQVIWRKPITSAGYESWEIGLQFVNISEEQQDIIQTEVAVDTENSEE
ncbi:MAG: PilZ domain-containing protein [SAR324 cluster bacterium]|nr:PilZ domain-containing protein [SAR324 cluster bacterium]